ncbi:RagB/SusD family nutrient uptake outer membrane protein [Paludibacter jiangxiensis]|uniref:Starch-binding associating with outer membrane n=1 Tax=Paludibacter jiangxiensis TaxID=681398 RepID=A0A170YHI1_9BACT|nr:RagB/SusD family nutrient uptake outer membrane protein [Paludibacter jiangxiensis]GAT61811.1 starch-binding associating with outer membrane [Paludibacter jiangxiensis]
MKKNIFILFLTGLLVMSCNDFLDRKSLTTMDDSNYWTSESNLRLFANGFYNNYFNGYNSSWTTDYSPLTGYSFSDDLVSTGVQTNFYAQAPTSNSSTSESSAWIASYGGPQWNFAWVRKCNLFINRIDGMKGKSITDEAYNHWSAVGRFFRGFEYSRLVSVFGNVPYYDKVVGDGEKDLLYKDRDDRTFVMDKVYDDLNYAFDNMRTNDGNVQYLNKYIAASFISRLMLFEGSWQKYHLNNTEKAKKYFAFAVKAANFVMASGKYNFTSDFRSLFGSDNLASNKEVILYRTYDATQSVTHAVQSYSDGYSGQTQGPNLDLAKSFICKDSKPYQLSTVTDADKFDIASMVKTRDPRFEATFSNTVASCTQSSSLLYAYKFSDRVSPTYFNGVYPAMYASNTNVNDAPVIRYAEVVLNWIEAKAELATMGEAAVTQSDIDVSINAIRNRPLDATAIARGVTKTAPLQLTTLVTDPSKDDPAISDLMWEIRRERRMEFVFEFARLMDIRRWKKIDYMNYTTHPEKMLGLWIDFPKELPSFLVTTKVGKLKVKDATGNVITYNGTNASSMVGFYIPENSADRNSFTNRVYLCPIGTSTINAYKDKGYTLTQTPGWE